MRMDKFRTGRGTRGGHEKVPGCTWHTLAGQASWTRLDWTVQEEGVEPLLYSAPRTGRQP